MITKYGSVLQFWNYKNVAFKPILIWGSTRFSRAWLNYENCVYSQTQGGSCRKGDQYIKNSLVYIFS